MINTETVWENEELAVFRLRKLYLGRGYVPYKMSKFEEYDLYARNKHFLVSENIITFTDTDGKLMALKPDVTLSIVKNGKDAPDEVQKLCYDEKVYRVSKGTKSFRELTQVGLECIGEVDDYCVGEVLSLAAKSLAEISPDYVLDISDLDLLGAVLDGMGFSEGAKVDMLCCIGEKNPHGMSEIAAREGIAAKALDRLFALLEVEGDLADAIPALRRVLPESGAEIDRLARVTAALCEGAQKGRIRLDFSVVNDMSYYNGIVFKGFISGVPAGVLSGGQYDGLMQKMGRHAKAIGFAVYLDLLERFGESRTGYDADAVLLYDEGEDPAALCRAADEIAGEKQRVTVLKKLPEGLKYGKLYRMKDGEVTLLETDA